MGNYRFKLSDMVPNAWIHKLRFDREDARITRKKKAPPPVTSSSLKQAPKRASYHFSNRHESKLPSSPVQLGRPDSARRRDTSLGVNDDDYEGVPCSVKPVIGGCRFTSSATDIILDMELGLRPIVTKEKKSEKTNGHRDPVSPPPSRQRRSSVKIQRLRSRPYKKIRHRTARKFLSESLAVVKTSSDPGRDFRESMIEMIFENNIQELDELEALLFCFLSLNAGEYHAVIVKAFERILEELTELRIVE